jgi:hypothetical protein
MNTEDRTFKFSNSKSLRVPRADGPSDFLKMISSFLFNTLRRRDQRLITQLRGWIKSRKWWLGDSASHSQRSPGHLFCIIAALFIRQFIPAPDRRNLIVPRCNTPARGAFESGRLEVRSWGVQTIAMVALTTDPPFG